MSDRPTRLNLPANPAMTAVVERMRSEEFSGKLKQLFAYIASGALRPDERESTCAAIGELLGIGLTTAHLSGPQAIQIRAIGVQPSDDMTALRAPSHAPRGLSRPTANLPISQADLEGAINAHYPDPNHNQIRRLLDDVQAALGSAYSLDQYKDYFSVRENRVDSFTLLLSSAHLTNAQKTAMCIAINQVLVTSRGLTAEDITDNQAYAARQLNSAIATKYGNTGDTFEQFLTDVKKQMGSGYPLDSLQPVDGFAKDVHFFHYQLELLCKFIMSSEASFEQKRILCDRFNQILEGTPVLRMDGAFARGGFTPETLNVLGYEIHQHQLAHSIRQKYPDEPGETLLHTFLANVLCHDAASGHRLESLNFLGEAPGTIVTSASAEQYSPDKGKSQEK